MTAVAGNTRPLATYGDFLEDVIKDRVERIDGVSAVNVFGGTERELQVVVDPQRLSRFRLTVPEVVRVLRSENISISAGDVDEGKRRYVVRTESSLNTEEALRNVVLRSDVANGGVGRVRVMDVAEVRFAYQDATSRLRFQGKRGLAFNVVRESGANVISVMEEFRAVLDELQTGPLNDVGLAAEQVYDETIYIQGTIDLVIQNIWIGAALAAFILLLFLRSLRATVIVSLAIPVSIVATFVVMALTGRTLNVISLAGIAFAVGMIVDAAIVVLENIFRLREAGHSRREVAYLGAKQVWGAILVSALTTVSVFIPILIMQLEAGQLFRDIAVAILVSVVLSLLVAVPVIPALSSRLISAKDQRPIRLWGVDHVALWFRAAVMAYVRLTVRSRTIGIMMVAVIAGGAAVASWTFLPKLEYLPERNRTLVFGLIIPPPRYSLETTETIAQRIEAVAQPVWEAAPALETADGTAAIDSFFFVATPGNFFVGAGAVDPARAAELIPVLSSPIFAEPGTFGFMTQPSLFGRGVGGGLNSSALAATVDAFNDGLRVAQVTIGSDRVNLVLKGDPSVTQAVRKHDMGNYPVVTPNGQIVPVSALAAVVLTAGPTEICHRERLRTVTVKVRPSNDLPLEQAVELLETEVVAVLQDRGLPDDIQLSVSGTADQLSQTWNAIQINLIVSLIIVLLVMAILFESFLLPLVIMIAVPVAAAGGVGGLALLNTYQTQPLDMLTLLGFIIFVGIVVNNAILIVHQTLYHLREDGMEPVEAIEEATQNRIRPIFMSTLTSVMGMLPLILFPGEGSELYSGLGAVVVGGLSLSAFLTLLTVPPLLRLCVRKPVNDQAAA